VHLSRLQGPNGVGPYPDLLAPAPPVPPAQRCAGVRAVRAVAARRASRQAVAALPARLPCAGEAARPLRRPCSRLTGQSPVRCRRAAAARNWPWRETSAVREAAFRIEPRAPASPARRRGRPRRTRSRGPARERPGGHAVAARPPNSRARERQLRRRSACSSPPELASHRPGVVRAYAPNAQSGSAARSRVVTARPPDSRGRASRLRRRCRGSSPPPALTSRRPQATCSCCATMPRPGARAARRARRVRQTCVARAKRASPALLVVSARAVAARREPYGGHTLSARL
jgi:hypothetical protein